MVALDRKTGETVWASPALGDLLGLLQPADLRRRRPAADRHPGAEAPGGDRPRDRQRPVAGAGEGPVRHPRRLPGLRRRQDLRLPRLRPGEQALRARRRRQVGDREVERGRARRPPRRRGRGRRPDLRRGLERHLVCPRRRKRRDRRLDPPSRQGLGGLPPTACSTATRKTARWSWSTPIPRISRS